MTVTEMKRELKAYQKDLKSLVRGAGDDIGCDGTGIERDDLQARIRGLLADLLDAGCRGPIEAEVYRRAHRNSRMTSKAEGGVRYVLHYIVGQGTCLVRVDKMTDRELKEAIGIRFAQ